MPVLEAIPSKGDIGNDTAQGIKPVWVMEEMHVLDIILVIDATHSIQVLEA